MTYTPILNAEVDAESPITDLLLTRMRDNPVAIAAGDAGAPRLYGLAMVPDSKVVADGKVLTVSAADIHTLSVGLTRTTAFPTNASGTDMVAFTITADFVIGAIRFKASHRGLLPGDTSIMSFFKNNVFVTSFSTTSGTVVVRTVDASVAINDVFEWRHRSGSGSSVVSASIQTASDAYSRIGALTKASDL